MSFLSSSRDACVVMPDILFHNKSNNKKPALAGFLLLRQKKINLSRYFNFVSLYGTCFLATGSYFLSSSFSGLARLFLVVV